MNKPSIVTITKFAEKQTKRLPKYVKEHFLVWAHSVEETGIRQFRAIMTNRFVEIGRGNARLD
jgi:hypothetical protein